MIVNSGGVCFVTAAAASKFEKRETRKGTWVGELRALVCKEFEFHLR